MAGTWRRVCDAVNPVSTSFTSWWCHSALRHMLTGYGPTARQRRLMRRGRPGMSPWSPPSAEQMEARRRAIDELLKRDDQQV
jgi:hypothetical protein